MDKFKCSQTGTCCRNLKARNAGEVEALRVKKGPILPMCNPEDMTLALWDWEIDDIEGAKVVPLSAIYDFISNRFIVLQYTLNEENCPFLRENLCSIHTNRPMVCKVYPLETDISNNRINFRFLECCNRKEIKTDIKSIYSYFGDIAEYAVQYDLINLWQKDMVRELSIKGFIKIRPNYPMKKLIRLITSVKAVPFSQFLVEKKVLSKEELDEKIEGFNSRLDARELLSS